MPTELAAPILHGDMPWLFAADEGGVSTWPSVKMAAFYSE